MKLTSMDITNKEFRKSLRGYDCDEVDEFLDKIADDYEKIYKENSSYKEKVNLLNEKVEHYAKIEDTIQNTLLLAQNAAEQAKQNAKKESSLIIKDANDSAQKIIDKANSDILKINDDYEMIRQDFMKFRAKFRNFMNTQLDMFESLEKDFMKNYNIGTTVDESVDDLQQENSNGEEQNEQFKAKDVDLGDESFTNDLNEIKSFFVKDE